MSPADNLPCEYKFIIKAKCQTTNKGGQRYDEMATGCSVL